MAGLYYEQFRVGQQFRHDVRRTVTEADNVLFSAMTHNPAAIHLDAEYARGTEFGKPILNSAFTLGLMVGISVSDTTLGTTVGNLGWDEVRFPQPVFPGDTLHVETEVLELRDSKSRPANGIVVFAHRAYNQRDLLVASCRRVALMLRQPETTA
ncbi:transcriptional regulator [Bordetella ansorpii]|uniref:Transcriptional regulator n=1 Tax=Bordetella ansorpii TaxID=288768 RepID=A0A157LX25_9BORD|nr:MaoC family dehydratase [Bordetella ansorpii]SAI00994.1 transcriptional regulator [Bordetella ansorpii]